MLNVFCQTERTLDLQSSGPAFEHSRGHRVFWAEPLVQNRQVADWPGGHCVYTGRLHLESIAHVLHEYIKNPSDDEWLLFSLLARYMPRACIAYMCINNYKYTPASIERILIFLVSPWLEANVPEYIVDTGKVSSSFKIGQLRPWSSSWLLAVRVPDVCMICMTMIVQHDENMNWYDIIILLWFDYW